MAAMAGASATAVARCYSTGWNGGTPALDPAVVAGKIVVCDRGTNDRVDKSRAVLEAGGVGMVLVNVSPNSLNADIHFVPTVHLADTDRAAVRAYAATAGATATLTGGTLASVVAPNVANFSSRGPALAGSGDLLKPDIMAPGVDILAAYSPVGGGRNWDFLSGTSMSSPHMAGMAALMKDLHPNWSPAAIKSAFMTTATTLRNNNTPIPGTPFGYGAGQVVPNSAADPGLVYDAGFNDWRNFLKGQALCNYCFGTAPAVAIDASDLNYPSIAIGALAGMQTVTRAVTNVGTTTATYNVSVVPPAGVDVSVNPASFTLAAGATRTYTVTFTTNGTAALNSYAFGSLTWSDGVHNVTSPLVIRPVALSAPAQVSSNGTAINYNVTFGYTGSFTATPRGLVPATTIADTVVDDPTNNFVVGGPGTKSYTVVIPAGTTYARFSLFDANVSPASDIDLYVYNSGNTLVGSSGSGTSNEEVNLVNPAADTYTVWVHGWQTGGPSANFTLFEWVLGSADAGNMTVTAPGTAVTGATGAINLTFNGLTPGIKYLGSVTYSGSPSMPNPTIVRVDP
jgi:hypothetical protein